MASRSRKSECPKTHLSSLPFFWRWAQRWLRRTHTALPSKHSQGVSQCPFVSNPNVDLPFYQLWSQNNSMCDSSGVLTDYTLGSIALLQSWEGLYLIRSAPRPWKTMGVQSWLESSIIPRCFGDGVGTLWGIHSSFPPWTNSTLNKCSALTLAKSGWGWRLGEALCQSLLSLLGPSQTEAVSCLQAPLCSVLSLMAGWREWTLDSGPFLDLHVQQPHRITKVKEQGGSGLSLGCCQLLTSRAYCYYVVITVLMALSVNKYPKWKTQF
jgi:hypothetical protein